MGLPGYAKTTDIKVNQAGIALCGYFDDGWGALVRAQRTAGVRYDDELVTAAAAAVRDHWRTLSNLPTVLVAVPSLRHPALVPDFAARLAHTLGIPLVDALAHTDQHLPQAEMRNSFQQAANLLNRFTVTTPLVGETVLLVDDIADSKWTLTMIGDLLQRHGAAGVYPFALAVTNVSE